MSCIFLSFCVLAQPLFQMVHFLYYHILETNTYPLLGLKSADVSLNGKDHQSGVHRLSSYIQDA